MSELLPEVAGAPYIVLCELPNWLLGAFVAGAAPNILPLEEAGAAPKRPEDDVLVARFPLLAPNGPETGAETGALLLPNIEVELLPKVD